MLRCGANHWTGFYMVTASVMKELNMSKSLFVVTLKHS